MKINVYDNSIVVIKSANKLADVEKVADVAPESMSLEDTEGNLLYSARIAKDGKGTINRNGVQFCPVAADDEMAKITIELPTLGDVAAADYIAKEYSMMLESFEALDRQIKEAAEKVDQARARVRNMINVVG